MALNYKVGNFTQPTTTNASFAVTGVGFTPKVLILTASNQTATGSGTNIAQYMGMATSTTNRVGVATIQTNLSNTAARGHDDTKCLMIINTVPSTIVAADLVSFDADGFTLNFSTVDSTARIIGYIAIGGTDLTNAFIKEFKPAASNTNQSFTGVGFKPDAIMLISSTVAGVPPTSDTGGCNFVLGYGISSASRFSNGRRSSGVTESAQVATEIIEQLDTGGTVTQQADLVSMDSDGFTLNFTQTGAVKYCYALCLKGGQYKLGTFNQSTSTGNQSITGVGFQPSGVMMMSQNLASTSSVITTSARMSFGAASSSTARVSTWNGGGNGGTMQNNIDIGKVINMITEGTPTVNASADYVSNDPDGFTINNTSVDATSREVVFFAIGSNASAATSNSLFGVETSGFRYVDSVIGY